MNELHGQKIKKEKREKVEFPIEAVQGVSLAKHVPIHTVGWCKQAINVAQLSTEWLLANVVSTHAAD